MIVMLVCSVIVSLTFLAEFGFARDSLSDFDKLSTYLILLIAVTIGWVGRVILWLQRERFVFYRDYKDLMAIRLSQDKELYGC